MAKKNYRQIVIVCPLGAGTFYTLSSLFSFCTKTKKKRGKKNRILVVEKVNFKCCSCCCCCCWGNSRARFSVASQRYFDEFRGLLKGAEAKNTKKHTRAAAATATATATIFELAAIRKLCVVQSVNRRRCCWLRRNQCVAAK